MPEFQAEDGARLHYRDEGEGLPLLCLPGLSRNAADFDHVAPHLGGVRLIRPDYRGRGRSAWVDPATYTVTQEARDVLGLMDHLGLSRAAILGTSRGGLVAMALAATMKHRLVGVALNDIGPDIAPAGLETIKGYLGIPPAQKSWEEAARDRAQNWTGFEGVPHERWLAEVRGHYDETLEGLVLRYDPALRDAVLGGAVQPAPDLWPLFEALKGLPTALIHGANSELLTADTAAEMRRRHPEMIFAEVPGRGHVPFLDEPEARAALDEWLARCRAATEDET